jgi:hypothetical protein
MQVPRGRGIQLLILDLGARWGEWSASRPGRIYPREKNPGTHWIGDWVGFRAGLDITTMVTTRNRNENARNKEK